MFDDERLARPSTTRCEYCRRATDVDFVTHAGRSLCWLCEDIYWEAVVYDEKEWDESDGF